MGSGNHVCVGTSSPHRVGGQVGTWSCSTSSADGGSQATHQDRALDLPSHQNGGTMSGHRQPDLVKLWYPHKPDVVQEILDHPVPGTHAHHGQWIFPAEGVGSVLNMANPWNVQGLRHADQRLRADGMVDIVGDSCSGMALEASSGPGPRQVLRERVYASGRWPRYAQGSTLEGRNTDSKVLPEILNGYRRPQGVLIAADRQIGQDADPCSKGTRRETPE